MEVIHLFACLLCLLLADTEGRQEHFAVKDHMKESLNKLPWKWIHEKTSYKVKTPLSLRVNVLSSYKISADAAGVEGIFNASLFENYDCAAILKKNPEFKGKNGVYTIYPNKRTKKDVYCDMTTDGGGWTLIQRRKYGITDFYRTWAEYKRGFGKARTDYWLGNDAIHILTSRTTQELWVDLEQFSGAKAYARYSKFAIADEQNRYKLTVSGYKGNAGDGLNEHNGIAFATKDRKDKSGCATSQKGGWWYTGCYKSHLNGPFHTSAAKTFIAIVWRPWKEQTALKSARMMIRPRK